MLGALRTPADARWYRWALGMLILAAWLAIGVWGASPSAGLLHHDEVGKAALPPIAAFIVFTAGWTVMTVAMMLPGAVPLLNVFLLMTGGRPDRTGLVLRLGAGYLTVWSLFGAAAYLGDRALHELVSGVPPLARVIAPGVILAAGLYQFSALKERCLVECRSPYAFIASRWHGVSGRREAWRLGLQHGLFCLGCCWVLMLVMFAVGVAHLGWMLALGAVMAAERALPRGRLLTKPSGAALIAWAVYLAVAGG
ncbi:MAG TPA: DUF2182 domain-containing protein [bacterium]|nr:DUF2182 domain-containing protein [bacterium]